MVQLHVKQSLMLLTAIKVMATVSVYCVPGPVVKSVTISNSCKIFFHICLSGTSEYSSPLTVYFQ